MLHQYECACGFICDSNRYQQLIWHALELSRSLMPSCVATYFASRKLCHSWMDCPCPKPTPDHPPACQANIRIATILLVVAVVTIAKSHPSTPSCCYYCHCRPCSTAATMEKPVPSARGATPSAAVVNNPKALRPTTAIKLLLRLCHHRAPLVKRLRAQEGEERETRGLIVEERVAE